MIPLLSLHSPKPSLFLTHFLPHLSTPLPRFKSPPHRTHHFPIHSFPNNQQQQQPANQNLSNQQPRTLFPGGYKRPEIKVPNIVLQLDPEDVIRGGSEALDLIDKAVSKSVGIVILNGSIGGGGSGKSLYEAACLVNSVVRDRAYLLIGERVDWISGSKFPQEKKEGISLFNRSLLLCNLKRENPIPLGIQDSQSK